MTFRNTADVWAYLRPQLCGRWYRLEVVTPDGLPDLIGFYWARSWWVEIKVHPDTVRPSQEIMAAQMIAQGVSVYVLSVRGARLAWYESPDDFAIGRVMMDYPVFLKR